MKKSLTILTITVLSLLFNPLLANAEKVTPNKPVEITLSAEEVKVMVSRIDEIKAMDKSTMSKAEKKELRKEVKAIKGTLAAGGVYISVGAILIIVLLLILLF